MIYTSKRHGVKDFIKSRNNIIYIAIAFIFIAVIVITVISINRYHSNFGTNKPGASPTAIITTENSTDETFTEAVGSYTIKINLANCALNIYENDLLVKQMLCGINSKLKEGEYLCVPSSSKRNTWFQVGAYFYRYYTNLGNSISFHSAGYANKSDKNSLITEEYNCIGSLNDNFGITLTVEDSKWIFEHCSTNSKIEIYSDNTEKFNSNFIEVPDGINWDPTDKSDGTPWCDTKVKSLDSSNEIILDYGSDISVLRSKFKALDQNNNDVTKYVLINGSLDLNKPGNYNIELLIADYSGNVLNKTISITIKEKPTEAETTTETPTTTVQTTDETSTDSLTTEAITTIETTEIETTIADNPQTTVVPETKAEETIIEE